MSRDGGSAHHKTVYESYINHGNHASGGGTINIHQTNYQFSLSNPLENRAALDSGLPFDPHHGVTRELFDSTHQKRPKRRLTNSGSSVDLCRPKKQRFGEFVLDIVKQTADFGNPLKAALAGVSALVEHYEEFKDVKDKIEGLLPQLKGLKHITITAMANEDPDETRRQMGLISALEDIERRSQELLKKGTTTRFADKGKDSAEVARLVEQFQEAIIHYQISQQQTIYDHITDLISSFSVLLKLQENSPALKNTLDSVMERLHRLCSAEDNHDDDNGWAKLFNTLRLIRDNGNKLYNRINNRGYNKSEDETQAVSEFAQDIQVAVLDYQIIQQRAIYDQNCRLIDAVDLAVLNNCRRARAAYQHGNRRGCLRGTREVVLNEIESWTKDFNKSPVFWLNGLAGTGKSTIAQTIAERAFADGLLGASFFCSRDFEDRSDLHFIFPTLAFQLAHKFPSFLAPLVTLLQTNPDIVDESLYNQMESLIVKPLRSAEISTVIVIDALDECRDDEPSSAMLSVLGRLVEQIPRVKFFITGRPEPRIKTGFRLPLLEDATKIFVLHDVEPDLINNDIQLFLKHELSELAGRHRLGDWPSDECINLLCQRANRLFVYAVATVKFLDSRTHLPDKRLDVIVNLPQCTIPEGKTQFRPRTTLDSLYMSVLQTAFSEVDVEVDSKLRSIIGAVVLLINPLPPSGIAELIQLDPREVMLLLTSVQSLLILDEDATQPVKSFHKSFPDFVTDPSRCNDTRFYISPEFSHVELAINCLVVLNNGLEQNFLDLPDYALNSEVKDLQTRIDGRVSAAMRYACQSWHNHLTKCRGDVTNFTSFLRVFLEKKFLPWLEVLSVLKSSRGAVVALEKLVVWLQAVSRDEQLLNTARDCFYFVTEFFEPINLSAPHIYCSALELSPLSSLIRKLYYHQRLTPFPRVEIGIPNSWRPSTAFTRDPSSMESLTWSPCGQYVAIRARDTVKIQDALTFELVSTLHTTSSFRSCPPSYSPDGHFLACITTTDITIWDIQTGGVAKQIECNLDHKQLVWSSDGRLVGVLSDQNVTIYDVASGRALSSLKLETDDPRKYTCMSPYLWAYKESFRVMTLMPTQDSRTIGIFEVGPALTKIESFSIGLVKGKFLNIGSFSPTTYRISGSFRNQRPLLILDIRNLETLLLENKGFWAHTFSPDGALFAACHSDDIHIWNYDGRCYIPWRILSVPSFSGIRGIHISRPSSSILLHVHGTLIIWRLNIHKALPICKRQLDIFSRSGTHIATADRHGGIIMITNVLSQTRSQFIDTDNHDISGLGLTGNVLLVEGPSWVGAWLLTEEGRLSNVSDNGRAGRGDLIWSLSVPSRSHPKFSLEGETGAIKYKEILHAYNSRTGEVLDSTQEIPHFSGPWYSFSDNLQAQDRRCNPSTQNPPKCKWKRSDTTWSWKDGWLKDHQGKCLLWLPSEWRVDWRRNVEWFPDVSTIKLTSRDRNGPVVIKL